MTRRRVDLAERIDLLSRAVDLSEGRIPDDVVVQARAVVERADHLDDAEADRHLAGVDQADPADRLITVTALHAEVRRDHANAGLAGEAPNLHQEGLGLALQLALEHSPVERVEDQERCFLAEGCVPSSIDGVDDARSIAVEMLVTVCSCVLQCPTKIAMADQSRLCQLFKYLLDSREPIIGLTMALSEIVGVVAVISTATTWAVDDWS